MTTTETSYMVMAFAGGILLGVIFFAGLWFTVKKVTFSKTPALLILGSFILRMVITLIGFYFISMGDWKNLLGCLIGFIIARFVVIRFTKLIDEKQLQLKKEVNNEA